MKGVIRASLRSGFKHFPTLLLFEILYKSVGAIIFADLAYYVQRGVPYISQDDIYLVFRERYVNESKKQH